MYNIGDTIRLASIKLSNYVNGITNGSVDALNTGMAEGNWKTGLVSAATSYITGHNQDPHAPATDAASGKKPGQATPQPQKEGDVNRAKSQVTPELQASLRSAMAPPQGQTGNNAPPAQEAPRRAANGRG